MSYKFLDFDLHPLRYQLRRGTTDLDVPRRIFDLILLLIRHRDRPVSKEEILSSVWHGRTVTDASLTHAVADARSLLGDSPESQSVIKTVPRRGYWWVAETREVFEESSSMRSRPFVGRRNELRALWGAFDDVRAGRGGFALIVGEAGVGKSCLAERFSAGLSRAGATAIKACAEDLSATPPLYLWRQVLAHLSPSKVIPALTSDVLLGASSFREEQSPETGRGGDLLLESRAARIRMYESLETAIRLAGERQRLALVLEDLHKADAASLEALHYIVERLDRSPVFFVATHRPVIPGSNGDAAAKLTRLARTGGARSILISNLTVEEVRDFLDELSDASLPPSATEAVFRASGGNPFLIWQLVALARSSGGLHRAGDSPLPSNVRSAIVAHVHGLPSDCRELLGLAAVIGQVFQLSVLADVAGMHTRHVSSRLKSCIDAGILRGRSPSSLEFSHALVRDALYEELDIQQRASLHLLIGNSMLSQFGSGFGDHLPSIAAHFCNASEVGGRETAISLLRSCGKLASRNLAFEDATRFLEEALRLSRSRYPVDRDEELHLLLAVGSARLSAGDRSGARAALTELVELAEEAGHSGFVAEAALSLAPSVLSLETGVVDAVLISTLERALDSIVGDDDARTEVTGRLALALYWSEDDDSRREAGALLSAAVSSGSLENRTRALLYSLGASWSPDTLDSRLKGLLLLSRRRGRLPDSLVPVIRIYRVATFLEVGSLNKMDAEVSALEQEIATARVPYCAWYPKMFRATQCLYRGEFDRALELAREYAEIGQRFEDSNVVNSFGAHLAEAFWLRGDARAALSGVEQFSGRFPVMPEWECVGAFFRAMAGRAEEAKQTIEGMGSSGFERLLRKKNMNFTIAAACLAEVVVRLDLRDWARPVYEMLLPFRGRNVVGGYGVISWGAVSRHLGELAVQMGRYEEGLVFLEEALRSDLAARSNPWTARSELAMARCLAKLEIDRDRVRRLSARAIERAVAGGMRALEEDGRQVLESAR